MKHFRIRTPLCLALALCMVLPLAACGRKKDNVASPDEETPSEQTVTPASVVNAPEVTYRYGWKKLAETTDVDGDFVPVLRFVASSDIHTRSDVQPYTTDYPTSDELEIAAARTAALFRLSYQYAEKSAYGGVDALVMVGDYTDYGRTQQYEAFLDVVNAEKAAGTELLVCLGNHEFWETGESGSTATDTTKTYARFEEYFGHAPDSHNVINGFHFIGISPDCNGGRNYSEEKAAWLSTQMRTAAADDPTGLKPIFVYQHISPANSVYGSNKTSDPGAAYAAITVHNVLKNYPQAVVFAGHSHRPTIDPACIMQKDYTVFNTGALTYGCYEIYTGKGAGTSVALPLGDEGDWYFDMADDWYEHGERESCIFTLIEIDAQNRVRVQYIDTDSGYLMQEPIIIDSIGKKDDFTLTVARAGRSELPSFKETDEITVAWIGPTAVRLSFPQVFCRDTVRDYKAELYLEGKLIDTVYRFSNLYFPPIPTSLIAPFSGLTPSTTYEVKIYAYNTWGKMGEPLCGSFTTPALETDGVVTPDILSVKFRNGTAYDAVSGKDLVKTGRAATINDATLDRTVGVFDGNGDYQWRDLPLYTDIMKRGFTYELYVKAERLGFANPSSAQQNGGFGFEFSADGLAQFWVFSKKQKKYIVPGSAMRAGEYLHLVGTFDGKNVCLYVNGELAASEAISGEAFFPVKPSTRYLSVGADIHFDYTVQSGFRGRIAAANLYATPLNAAQVAALYNNR